MVARAPPPRPRPRSPRRRGPPPAAAAAVRASAARVHQKSHKHAQKEHLTELEQPRGAGWPRDLPGERLVHYGGGSEILEGNGKEARARTSNFARERKGTDDAAVGKGERGRRKPSSNNNPSSQPAYVSGLKSRLNFEISSKL